MPTIHVKVDLDLDLPTAVPDKLVRLLAIDKKAELERYCAGISVTPDDFAALTLNCGQHGYVHDMRYYAREPKNLCVNLAEKIWPMGKYKPGDKLDAADQRLMGMFTQRGKVRRLMTVHVFVAAGRWHVFYFDQRDMTGNHWRHGPHMHFANHLWPNYSLEKVLKIFSTPDGALGGTIHLRFDGREPDATAE